MVGEEGGGEHGVDGQLGRAAHEGGQQNGHPPVPLAGEGAGGHDGGHAAPEADEHGHETAAGKADLAQKLIHHEGHPGHVARVLQDGQEEEQGHDDGQEGEHAAHAGKDAVDDEAVHHRVDAVGGEALVRQGGELVQPQAEQVAQALADEAEGEPEHHPHDGQEDGDGQHPVGEDAVDLHAAGVLAALAPAHHRLGAHLPDEAVAHVRQRRLPVGAHFALHLGDGVLHHVLLVFREVHLLQHGRVALHQLGGGKPHRHPGPLGVVLDEVADGVDAPVHRAGAEVQPLGLFPVQRHLHGVLDELVDALVLGRRDGDDRDAQGLLQVVHMHRVAVGPHLVHHVQRQHHGDAQLDELQGQVEVALDVGGVHDVDDAVRLVVHQKIPGHDLLAGVGREGIDARQVHHRGLGMLADLAVLAVHRHAGEVAHVLVGAGELVEQGGLAAVLVARQREHQGRVLRQGRALFLAVAGVGDGRDGRLGGGGRFARLARFSDLNVLRVLQPQGQFIAPQFQFDGVPHGGGLAQGHPGARRQAHVQKMTAQRTFASHRLDGGGFAQRQLVQRHCCGTSSFIYKN